MINELLQITSMYPKKYLQDFAQNYHKLAKGCYFKLSLEDRKLSKPYIYDNKTMEPDPYFLLRDFWSAYDAQKSLDFGSGAIKRYKSGIYLSAGFTLSMPLAEDTFDCVYKNLITREEEENRKKEKGKATLIDKVPPIDRDFARKCLDLLSSAYKEAYEIAKENNIGDKVLIRIFIDVDVEKYQTEGTRYLYLYQLFPKDKPPIIENGQVVGPLTNFINYNVDKGYLFPAGMKVPVYIEAGNAYRMFLMEKIINAACGLSNERERPSKDENYGVIYIPYDGDLSRLHDSSIMEGYRLSGQNKKSGFCIDSFSFYEASGGYDNNSMKNVLGVPNIYDDVSLKRAIYKYFFIEKRDDNVKNRMSEFIEDLVTDGTLCKSLKDYVKTKLLRLLMTADYYEAYNMINTYMNMIGVKEMMDIKKITCDDEYYFAAGQLARWLCNLSESSTTRKRNLGMFIGVKSDKMLKTLIKQEMSKYANRLRADKDFGNIVKSIFSYKPSEKISDMFLAGLYADNQLYTKKDMEEEENEE